MENLLQNVENHVLNVLRSKLEPSYLYHNIGHTLRVVRGVEILIDGEKIDSEDANKLKIAAWFHDIGYINGSANHEDKSVEMAAEFLKTQKVNAAFISKISALILATKMGHEAQNNLEYIIRDADSMHFAQKDFLDISELLRLEWEQTSNIYLTEIEWIEKNIEFFTRNHTYYSTYALENWLPVKDKNLTSLYKKLRKLKIEDKKSTEKSKELALKKTKKITPERGIETMFRVTLRNHITLSDIADTKANILLSVNAIIISMILANLFPKLDNPSNEHLIWPTLILVGFTLTTMIFSVIATRPNVTSGKFTKADVKAQKVNLLFFGNFHKMKLSEFEWAIGELMKDRNYLYSSMTKDLYFLGKVLDRKYKILRVAYMIFVAGIIASVIAFGITFFNIGIREI